MVRWICLALMAWALQGCGDSRPSAPPKSAAPQRAAQAIQFPQLLAWAEATYPQWFSGASDDGVYAGYTYRHYQGSNSYIGIADSKVYALGAMTGNAILDVGTLADFQCRVAPASCTPVREENDDFSGASVDTCRWFDWHQSGASGSQGSQGNQGNGLRMLTSAASTFSAARRVSQYRVKGDVQMEVSIRADSGFEAIPQGAQLYASFGLMADDNNRYFISLARSGDRRVIHVLRVASAADGSPTYENLPDIDVATDSVRLRITQTGTGAQLAYNADGTWRTAATLPAFTAGSYVEFTASSIGVARSLSATFSDFRIASGDTSWRRYVRGPQQRRTDLISGGTGGDSMNYRTWGNTWGNVNPLQAMKDSGMTWYGTDVTFNSSPELAATPPSQWGTLAWNGNFWRSKEIVAQDLKNAAAAGLRLYLQLYLTTGPAHFGTQSAPAAWQGLSVAETASKLRSETFALVSSYKAQGIPVEVYSVGNEIDIGILQFRPGERIALPPAGMTVLDVNYLRASVWPTEAILLKAGIEGVKAADPNAKIVLHIAGLSLPVPSDIFTKAFFKFMVDQGVPFDIAALSHPYMDYVGRLGEYSTDCWMQRIQETTDYIATLGKKSMISEANYPRATGDYASAPMPEFSFSDAGQAGWVREHLRHANNDPNMAGFLYWYPDYFIGMSPNDPGTLLNPQNTGLFYPNLLPTPAMLEYGIGPYVTP